VKKSVTERLKRGERIQTTAYLAERIRDRLDACCEDTGLAVSAVINVSLAEYLPGKPGRKNKALKK